MKKILSFILTFCCFISMLNAEENQMIEAEFIQRRILSHLPKPIESQGNIILWEGKGLIWSISKPFPSTLVITKKGLYQFEEGSKTEVVKANGDHSMFDVMARIFNLKEERAVKGFIIENLAPNENHWKMRLLPQHSQVKNFITAITVEGGQHPTHLTIVRPSGDRDEIEIKNHVVKESISPFARDLLND